MLNIANEDCIKVAAVLSTPSTWRTCTSPSRARTRTTSSGQPTPESDLGTLRLTSGRRGTGEWHQRDRVTVHHRSQRQDSQVRRRGDAVRALALHVRYGMTLDEERAHPGTGAAAHARPGPGRASSSAACAAAQPRAQRLWTEGGDSC